MFCWEDPPMVDFPGSPRKLSGLGSLAAQWDTSRQCRPRSSQVIVIVASRNRPVMVMLNIIVIIKKIEQ